MTLSAFVSIGYGLPTGAPTTACKSMTPSHLNYRPQTSASPFRTVPANVNPLFFYFVLFSYFLIKFLLPFPFIWLQLDVDGCRRKLGHFTRNHCQQSIPLGINQIAVVKFLQTNNYLIHRLGFLTMAFDASNTGAGPIGTISSVSDGQVIECTVGFLVSIYSNDMKKQRIWICIYPVRILI